MSRRKRKVSTSQFGHLEPRYRFFLNPYADVRFTRCPECERTTKPRKHPFFVFVEPNGMSVLNMTGRYCPACDLLILHKDRLENLLVHAFEENRPELIGHDYWVVGTLERSFWRRRETEGGLGTAAEHLHEFVEEVTFELEPYGWLPAQREEKKERPTAPQRGSGSRAALSRSEGETS